MIAACKVPVYRSICDKARCQAAQAKPLKGAKRLSEAQKTSNQYYRNFSMLPIT